MPCLVECWFLPIVQLAPESAVETAVAAALLKVTNTAEMVRWIKFPASVLWVDL